MPLDDMQAREDGLENFPARFDAAEWTSYDPRDAAAIPAVLQGIGFHEDADSVFLARSLDYVKARVLLRRRPPLAGERLVPISRDTPVGAQTVSWTMYDDVGMAKIIGNYVDDLPRADVRGAEMFTKIRDVGVSYGYSTQDLRAAAQARTNLPVRKGDAARRATELKHNSLMFKGEAAYGMVGILTHPNIPVVVPTTGAWATATGEQIVVDMSKALTSVQTQSRGVHRATVAGLPNRAMSALRLKRLADNVTTAFAFIRANFPEVEFVEAEELHGAGSGGTDVIFVAERDEENYSYEEVMPFTQHPPQARNLEFVVPCESRTGGVVVRYPLALAKMEGI